MTITKMTSEEINKKWTPQKIKGMIEKAKKKPIDESEIITNEDIASGRVRKVGRPKIEFTKKKINIRFDYDVAIALKSLGRGWSTKVNDVMREFLVKNGALAKR